MRCCSRAVGPPAWCENERRDGPAGGYYIYEIASSAEGATFTSKPGATPQGYENQKNISAESAIHFRHTSWISAY